MEKMATLVSCLLLVVGVVTAQTVPSQTNGRPLPQWLTGIIAVAGFLFLSFVTLLVKKAWCEVPNRERNSAESLNEDAFVMNSTFKTDLGANRSRDHETGYDNLVIDISEEKITTM